MIDTSGELDGVKYANVVALGKALAADQEATMCVTRRLYEYATGHGNAEDSPLVPALEKSFAANKYNFRSLLQKVASMPEAYRVSGKPLAAATKKVTLDTSSNKQGS